MSKLGVPQLTQLKNVLQSWKIMSAYERCHVLDLIDNSGIDLLQTLEIKAMYEYRQFIKDEPLLDDMDAPLFYKFRMCQTFSSIAKAFDTCESNQKSFRVVELVENGLNDIFSQITITDDAFTEIDAAIEKEKKIVQLNIMSAVLKARASGMSAEKILAFVAPLGDASIVENMLKNLA